MKLRPFIMASCLFLFTNIALASDDITKELMKSGGKTRVYYLYVPATVQPSSPAPLVVMLHGSNRTGNSLVEKWKDLAKKESFIIAGPDALNLRGWGAPQDGPEFLRDLVEELKTKYPVNQRRVYLVWSLRGRNLRARDVSARIAVFRGNCHTCGCIGAG